MALIRQANATRVAQGAIVLDLGDIRRQGEELRARAREEAVEIVAAAKRERDWLVSGAAESGHREGYGRGLHEGRIEGEAAGRDAALAEFREKLTRLDAAWAAALTKLEQERDGMLLEAKRDVLALAIAMGEAVIKRAIAATPGVVEDQLAAVLAQVAHPTRLTIRVNPEDRSLIDRALPAMLSRIGTAHHIELADDAALERGSVIAATSEGGEVDASIRTQLERICSVLVPGERP